MTLTYIYIVIANDHFCIDDTNIACKVIETQASSLNHHIRTGRLTYPMQTVPPVARQGACFGRRIWICSFKNTTMSGNKASQYYGAEHAESKMKLG